MHRQLAEPLRLLGVLGLSREGGDWRARTVALRQPDRGRHCSAMPGCSTTDEVQRTVFEKGGYPAAITSVYEDRGVEGRQPYTQALKEGIRTARSRPVTPYYGQVTRLVQEAAFSVLRLGEEPARAAERLAGTLAAALDGR
jgi:multiple sugar transport system substrate-binding protein